MSDPDQHENAAEPDAGVVDSTNTADADGTLAGEGSVDDSADDAVDDGLLSRLRVIEDQPLGDRAAALTQIHDELRARLEASDSPRGA
ncbi:hypothetical protein [Schumannella sp. 10F1B-5-1]|uniref:hypothetical protein n=1 Tax=Schumannella sp. 10F1B-5-1 TaxID=2590780 RepID=UPI001130D449|nr:hypothetical protein [Schumannella sp. 10F1B-5-1]TPW73731.1 hypothetical protein FJ658_03670 [Schumannella sp. 10F1B-5-1]